MLWEILKNEDEEKKIEGEMDRKNTCKELDKDLGLELSAARSWADDNSSPLAMCFNQEKGWVTEPWAQRVAIRSAWLRKLILQAQISWFAQVKLNARANFLYKSSE